ncbi:TetR/AcrR family transcriptional regulator [uncultured Jatrophihabitans sp.]|uniref:TetR/AcrR family transcriptional regulator n=1 Tax=uncultured Jatrophihabitans sp. TaxID=1610747 RepID=UPI0035CB7EEB
MERIVAETLALIDDEGIAMTSMRSVGDRLGVRAMSLYRYVRSRDELFDLVVEHVVDELEADPEVRRDASAGWRDYLSRLAWGVRRYARAHPHAFPLVATRPPEAPWINPPLRSLRWVEEMLGNLRAAGFDDEQVLFAYRSFNSFLLGYLLLETSAMALRDPKPGDGSFQRGGHTDSSAAGDAEPASAADPIPGSLSPTRTVDDRASLDAAEHPHELIDPVGEVDSVRFPIVRELRAGLTEDRYEAEFVAGLDQLLNRIQEALPAGS